MIQLSVDDVRSEHHAVLGSTGAPRPVGIEAIRELMKIHARRGSPRHDDCNFTWTPNAGKSTTEQTLKLFGG
jgi:hypothetical protein